MKQLVLTASSIEDTEKLGKAIGTLLEGGEFIALMGDLGAGKTTLTRAVARELGINNAQSPTFTIVREHTGTLPLLHFDAYRLSCADELYAIGFDDYLARKSVIIMEWCENVSEALPPERLEIRIFGNGDDARTFAFTALGARYERLLGGLQ